MPQSMVLMTAHGTIVCADGAGGLCHVAIDGIDPADTPLLVDAHAVTRAGQFERLLLQTNQPMALGQAPGLPPGCELLLTADRRTASLRVGNVYFSAEPATRELACNRDSASTWEHFLFLTPEDFAIIRLVMARSWIIGSTKQLVGPAQAGLREGFILALGPLALDLRYNLPFIVHEAGPGGSCDPFSLTVLIDGWKIERIHRYDPMIYLTAFGSPDIMDRAYTAIGSLLEFGGYAGRIHVITDRDAPVFEQHVPALAPGQLTVQPLTPQDTLGYLAAKLLILDHPPAFSHQPVFFMDSDVVCDAPLEAMLVAAVTIGRISAPLEDTTSLRTNPSVGATLIQRAGLSPNWACGLNTGTIGMPNLAMASEALELTRAILTNHADLFGRDGFPWVDQEVLNYVSYRAAHFDTEALLRFVRYGWPGCEFDATRRLGLVHFWPPVEGRPKQDRMRDYVATLRASRR